MRLLIGTLREEGLLDDTIIMFISDHGDMLGNHNLWAKSQMYENSAKIPMILVPTINDSRVTTQQQDARFAALRDVMPTLLDLCNIPIPESVEGESLIKDDRREYLCCEHYEDERSVRMIRVDEFKLIWFPVGNHIQLFDLKNDHQEMHDIGNDASCAKIRDRLVKLLIENLYGKDLDWIEGGKLVGEADRNIDGPSAPEFKPRRDLNSQRGWR
jgi:arylsulfatase A-like enzyme